MRPDHNKLQITTNLSIGEQVLGGLELELVYEYAPQVTFLFFPNVRIFGNSLYFSIQRVLFGLRRLLHFLLKRSWLVNAHDELSKLVFGFFALFQFIQSNEDFLYEGIW